MSCQPKPRESTPKAGYPIFVFLRDKRIDITNFESRFNPKEDQSLSHRDRWKWDLTSWVSKMVANQLLQVIKKGIKARAFAEWSNCGGAAYLIDMLLKCTFHSYPVLSCSSFSSFQPKKPAINCFPLSSNTSCIEPWVLPCQFPSLFLRNTTKMAQVWRYCISDWLVLTEL